MSLPIELQRIKASGVYFLEQDESQIANIEAPTGLRLLLTNSKKGPVNTLVYVETWEEFKNIFGGISRIDERKGDYSKRTAFYMLSVSPIYVLNLRSFDDTLDLAGKVELSADTGESNQPIENVPYRSLFNAERFWEIDSDDLIDPSNTSQLLTFVNIGTEKLSVFIRRSNDVDTSLTFQKWYNNLGRDMPEFINPNDLVRDWFVDVFVFKNDFSDLNNVNTNSSYGSLFDGNGLLKEVNDQSGQLVDGLQALAENPNSGFVNRYTGSLVPGFIDESGNVTDVVQLLNSEVNIHGCILAYNQNVFDQAAIWEATLNNDGTLNYGNNGAKRNIPVDLIGHNTFDTNLDGGLDESSYPSQDVDLLSYSYQTSVSTINQTVSDNPTATDFQISDPDFSLLKVTGALLPGKETVSGADYLYDLETRNSAYFFEPAKPNINSYFISRTGNLTKVNDVEFVGVKTFLPEFGTLKTPITPSVVTDFDSGNDSFGVADQVSLDANVLLLSDGSYDNSLLNSTVVAGSGTVNQIDVATGTVGTLENGDIIKVASQLAVVDTFTSGGINDTITFQTALSVAPSDGEAVITANANLTVLVDSILIGTGGNLEIVDVTDLSITTISVNASDLVGFYTGGFQVFTLTPFNYEEYVGFPLDPTGTYYVYPTGHPLEGEPLVASSTNDNKIIHNPSLNGANNLYQKDANGNDLIPSFPSTGYNPSTEEIINVLYSDLSAEQITAAKSSVGVSWNLYRADFDQELMINDTQVAGNNGNFDQVTSVGDRDTEQIIVLDDSTEIIVYNNNNALFWNLPPESIIKNYNSLVLTSYRPRKEQFLDGTKERQNQVLDVMINTGLRKALINREIAEFDYIVDGFESYVQPNLKSQLAIIASERILCLALANGPSIKAFQKSKDPYFRDSVGGEFDLRWVPQGGNLSLPYTNTFSLPSVGNTHIAFFGPHVILSDSGQAISFPPAGLVSNNYYLKTQGGKIYDIIGGPDNGRISGQGVSGLEYIFSEDNTGGERKYLENFGYNPIISRTSSGIQIYGNQTAQNNIFTALSYIHVRELVRFLQQQIGQILEQFVFKYNTPQNRLTIKTQADAVCEEALNDGALVNYQNIMNESNNTAEVINNSFGILDTVITPNKGMQKLVHRTTINALTGDVVSFELL